MNNFLRLLEFITSLIATTVLMNAQWVQTIGPYGGNITSLVVTEKSIYAGTSGGGGIYLSTNNGESWEPIGLSNKDIGVLMSSGMYIWAGTQGHGIFCSTDNGANWREVNNGLTNKYMLSFTISGANAFAGTTNGIFLSTNNGNSWKQISNGLTNNDIRALASMDGKIFAGTPDGVYIKEDSGTAWKKANNGLTNTYINALVTQSGCVIAGTRNGLFRTSDNGINWNIVGRSDKEFTALSTDGVSIVAGTGYTINDIDKSDGIYQSIDNTGLFWIQVGANNTVVNALTVLGKNIFSATQHGIDVYNGISK